MGGAMGFITGALKIVASAVAAPATGGASLTGVADGVSDIAAQAKENKAESQKAQEQTQAAAVNSAAQVNKDNEVMAKLLGIPS